MHWIGTLGVMTSSVSRTARHGARLLAYSHATVDFYQGAVAALVPFLVMERGYSYAAAAGIVMASSLSSSIVQPLFGALGDKWRMQWLLPFSIFFGGAGIAAISFTDTFWATATVAAVSGIGVAAFHPAGAQRSREISGDDHVVMSWFSLGGGLGFAAAPLFVAATVGVLGLSASPLLMIPAATGLVSVLIITRITGAPAHSENLAHAKAVGRDNWRAFLKMSGAIIARSILFVGLGSFLVLFLHQHRGFSDFAATAALFVFYLGGAFGTTLGGHLARHWPRTRILRWSYIISIPIVAGILLVPGPTVFVFIALGSIALYAPFSLHVSLGQDYLPKHMGTANGVTLGLAVSVGGLASPAIGALADNVGLEYAVLPLIALPALAWLALIGLKEPRSFTAPEHDGISCANPDTDTDAAAATTRTHVMKASS